MPSPIKRPGVSKHLQLPSGPLQGPPGGPIKRPKMPGKPPDPTGTGGPSSHPSPQQQREATVTAADGVIPIIYGTVRVGGKIFYVNASAGSLYIALAFCEGPIHALTATDITIDGETLTTCQTKGWISSYDIKTGGLSQTVSSLLSGAFSYTQTHPGLCYVVLKIAGKAPWSSIPAVLATVQGTECYDPRDNSTAYTTNPALIVRDMMVRCGELSATEDVDFDDTSVGDAADYYAATVDGESRYALNIAIISSTNLRAELGAIKAQCALDVYWDQGVFVFAPDKVLSSPIALDDSHLKNLTISRKDFSQTPNRVIVRWTNAAKDWVTDSATAETDELVAGTEDLVEASYDCAGITSMKTAQRHALYLLRRANFCSVTMTATLSPMAERLRRGDYVTITNRSRLTAQGAIVVDARPSGNGEFAVTFEEYDANAYSTATYVADTPPSTSLPDPFVTPEPIDAISSLVPDSVDYRIYWAEPRRYTSQLFGTSYWSSTGFTGFDGTKINDGNTSVSAGVPSAGAGCTLTLDLGSGNAKEFGRVRAWGTDLGTGTAIIEWSDDGSSWTEVTMQLQQWGAASSARWSWEAPGSHRYWRLVNTYTMLGATQVNEVQFYEITSEDLYVNKWRIYRWDGTAPYDPPSHDELLLEITQRPTVDNPVDIRAFVIETASSGWWLSPIPVAIVPVSSVTGEEGPAYPYVGGYDAADANVAMLVRQTGATPSITQTDSSAAIDGEFWAGAVTWKSGSTGLAVPGVLFTQTADSDTTANSLTSLLGTGVGTKTLPAGFLLAGRCIEIEIAGYVQTADGAAGTKQLDVLLGSTTVATGTGASSIGSTVNMPFEAKIRIACRTAGSSGTVSVVGTIRIPSTTPASQDMVIGCYTATTTTLDTTPALAIDVKYNNGNATGVLRTKYARITVKKEAA